MLARRQSAREMFIEMGGVGHVAGVLTRLGTPLPSSLLPFRSLPACPSPPLTPPPAILTLYVGANGNAQQIYELTFILWTLSLGCAEKDLALFLSAGKSPHSLPSPSLAPSLHPLLVLSLPPFHTRPIPLPLPSHSFKCRLISFVFGVFISYLVVI